MNTTQLILLDENEFQLTIVRSKKRRRTVALSMKAPAEIIIRAPHRTTMTFIENFIRDRSHWILAKFAEFKQRQMNTSHYEFVDGEQFYFLGQSYVLRIIANKKIKFRGELTNTNLLIYIRDDLAKEQMIKYLTKWYQEKAKQIIFERLIYWQQQLNISFNRFFLSRAKTNWGSCNAKNDIRINWRLIMMPTEIIDYVIVHELCHVIHKNHSKRFWNLVHAAMPDFQQRRNELTKLGREMLFF